MAVRITAIRLSGGTSHQHITNLWWTNQVDDKTGQSTRAAMVEFIEGGGKAFVNEGGRRVDVYVRTPVSGPKYLQTQADGYWANNLLALPRK